MNTQRTKNSMSASTASEREKVSGFALGKQNFILIGISFAAIIIGFALMMGPGSTEKTFNPDIFSFRRLVVAPTIAFAGFVFMIYAIMRKPK